MKRISITVLLLFNCICLYAQSTGYAKLSASAQQYLWRQQKYNTADPHARYVYKTDEQQQVYVSVLMQVQAGFDEAALDPLHVHIGTKAGSIYTLRVPEDNLEKLSRLKGIRYIDMDAPVYSLLDSARKATRVDSVQKGIGLPQPYNGTGVIMGVIDVGFDYTHPTFFDTTYSKYRIKRVWEEKTTSGTPPAGFSYGSEYTDSASIIAKGHDRTDFFHGSHVAGIAAGSGAGGPGGNSTRYRGMAYGSDIALVAINPDTGSWASTGLTDFLDAMNYIYNYAASVNKPVVINLSWGSVLGPHDGNSLFSQACDNLTGPGKIFVLSAGNSGEDTIHFQKTFSATDSLASTFPIFSYYLPYKRNWIDVWGAAGKSFCMQFSLYNGGIKRDSTVFFCLDNATHQVKIVGSDNDTCYITLTASSAEYNGKPRMLLDVSSYTGDSFPAHWDPKLRIPRGQVVAAASIVSPKY